MSNPGLLFVRSLPRTWSMGLKSEARRLIGGAKVTPLSCEMARPSFTVKKPEEVRQITNASLDPLPANRGLDDCPSMLLWPTVSLVDQVGANAPVAAADMLSE